MEKENVVPKIVISRCIEFDKCRYNEQSIKSDFVKDLKPFVEFKKVCPEIEIGLGVPRNPIRLVKEGDDIRLVQPSTNRDLTEVMKEFSNNFLNDLDDVDGVILKSRSPSCGLKDVKVYDKVNAVAPSFKSSGLFGKTVLTFFSNTVIEDEGRLRNSSIRNHFLVKLYTYTRFRTVKNSYSLEKLNAFHKNNELLFNTYNKKAHLALKQFMNKKTKKNFEEIIAQFQEYLNKIFAKGSQCSSNLNFLIETFAHIKNKLSDKEKAFFLDIIDEYRTGKISAQVPLQLLKSWIIRFDIEFLITQTIFNPYPRELLDIETVNACTTRNLWK
jgi:uncharacterized protein YbbK (DUF523 family)/uncharacterized protein YbgA (DUF1722 family)